MYRRTAVRCLQRAKRKLRGNPTSATIAYACLDLRLAIEALAYERLTAYAEEVSFPTLATWQPGRLLKELAEIDPEANQDRNISLQVELEPGKWTALLSGPDNRFTAAWAYRMHNALGNFLHVPTLAQREVAEHERCANGLIKALEVAAELERVFESTTWNTKIGSFMRFDCDCGARLARRPDRLGEECRVECAECRALFDVKKIGVESYEISRSKQTFACPQCGTGNAFSTEWILTKPGLRCRECKEEFDTSLEIRLVPRGRAERADGNQRPD